MEHYVTLFDSLFLPQGLALHRSMERHVEMYTLWVLCVDDLAYDVLTRLKLPNIQLIKLSDVETNELKNVKNERTRAEYCWTLTPFTPRFVFESDESAQRVTYIDADVWFRKNPTSIFKELDESGKSVLITEHAYAPEYDQSATSGVYCVQFITFTRGGELVRKWWEERCIEWCYNRFEDGKFGDQKYLDEWPSIFAKQVHVVAHVELFQAPWNSAIYPYSKATLYHFHGLRLLGLNRVLFSSEYTIPKLAMQYIYKPYLSDIKHVNEVVNNIGHTFIPQVKYGIFMMFFFTIAGKISYALQSRFLKKIRNIQVILRF